MPVLFTINTYYVERLTPCGTNQMLSTCLLNALFPRSLHLYDLIEQSMCSKLNSFSPVFLVLDKGINVYTLFSARINPRVSFV